MFWFVRVFIARLAALTSRYCLRLALTPPARGGVRNDRLHVKSVRQRLEVEWNARGIHPWDRDEGDEVATVKFLDQFLADTEGAIDRIFQVLPGVNEIAVTVRKPDTGEVIAAGTVDRGPREKQAMPSARMRLLARGMKCYLDETYCERLQFVQGHTQ